MEKSTLEFNHNARTVFTAIKHLFETKRTPFSNVSWDGDLFIIEARHGLWISPFSEKIKIKIRATSTTTSQVFIESSSRSILNILNLGANRANISDLTDYISNEVHKLCQPGEIKMREAYSFKK